MEKSVISGRCLSEIFELIDRSSLDPLATGFRISLGPKEASILHRSLVGPPRTTVGQTDELGSMGSKRPAVCLHLVQTTGAHSHSLPSSTVQCLFSRALVISYNSKLQVIIHNQVGNIPSVPPILSHINVAEFHFLIWTTICFAVSL